MNEHDFWAARAADSSDDELFEDLARNAIGTDIAQNLITEGGFADRIPIGFDALDNLHELGIRIFERVSREFYETICGKAQSDTEDRKKILSASGLSEAAVLTALTTALSGAFDLGVTACTILAALLYRRIIKPAGDEVCKYWKEKFL